MTEPQSTKPVDLAGEDSPFAGMLGEPLVVDVSIKEGRLTPESLRTIGDEVAKRMAARGAPAAVVDRLKEKVTDLLGNPERQDAIYGQSVQKRRARIEGAMQGALSLLEDLPDLVRDIGSLKSDMVPDRNVGHQFAYTLGIASGGLLTCLNELAAAGEAFAAAFKMLESKPTEPTTTPEASPDAP